MTWKEGWPALNGGRGPSAQAAVPERTAPIASRAWMVDEFASARLDSHWQWPWDRAPERSIAEGVLTLRASGRDPSNPADTIVARPAANGDYVVTARVLPPFDPLGFAGVSIYGNAANAIGIRDRETR